MAAQTEAPDDLIAELARLMADDAKTDQPAKDQPAQVRIPGDANVAAKPVPRFDFSASADHKPAAEPASSVRIPGSAPSMPEAKPVSFEPGSAGRPAVPPTPVAGPTSPVAPVPAPSEPAAPEPAPAPLDHDSLADLIAAELANDLTPAPESAPPAETRDAPAEGGDNFGVPPVFGLGSATAGQAAPSAPRVTPQVAPDVAMAAPAPAEQPREPDRAPPEADPLDEMERLVGPAVRLGAANAPSPALRSLATPTIPVAAQPAQPAEVAPQVEPRAATGNSVDDAILAAAAATGAHVEWVNADRDGGAAPAPEARASARMPSLPRIGVSRAVAGPLVALGLLVVAGLGLYWVLGQGGGDAGPAPLVVADTSAIKEVPEVEETASAPQSVVFNEISGADTGAEEQIVSRDQADTEAVVAANGGGSSSGVLAAGDSASVDPNQDGLVNRKVRTVTVRPDGTIVSGDDTLAGSAILPVDRPNVPEVPGADTSTPELLASAETGANASAASEPAETTPAPEPAETPAEPGAVVPVVNTAGVAVAGRSVTLPMQRPDDFAQTASAALAAAASAPTPAAAATETRTPIATAPATQAPATATPAPAAGAGSSYVQLASQRSEEAARQSAQAIATRYGVLFGGANLEIQRVDLGERGIYYRVLVPAASRDSAANICTNVKAAGGDCLLL